MVDMHRASVGLTLVLAASVLIATSAPPQDLRTATQFVTIDPGATVVGTIAASRRAVRRTDSSEISVTVSASMVGDAGMGDAGSMGSVVLRLNELPSRVSTGFAPMLYPDWHALCDRSECELTLSVTNEGTAPVQIDVTANMHDAYEGGLFCGGGGTYPEDATMTLTFESPP